MTTTAANRALRGVTPYPYQESAPDDAPATTFPGNVPPVWFHAAMEPQFDRTIWFEALTMGIPYDDARRLAEEWRASLVARGLLPKEDE